MDADAENIKNIIQKTLDASTVEGAYEEMEEIISNPETTEIFFRLYHATTDPRIRHQSIVYCYKVIDKNWSSYSEENQNQIKSLVFDIIQNQVFPQDVECASQLVEKVYNEGSGKWPELLGFLFAVAEERKVLVSSIFVKISQSLHSGFFEECFEQLNALVNAYLHDENQIVKVAGVALLAGLISQIEDDNEEDGEPSSEVVTDAPETYSILNDMEAQSLSYEQANFSKFWFYLGNIAASGKCRPEVLSTLMQTGFGIAGNEEVAASKRFSVLNAVANGINVLSAEEIGQILTVAINIGASTIAEDEVLPTDQLSLYETILNSQSHSETYPILGEQLMEALQSESVEHQAAAMLVLRVVLITTPEFALKDAETIMSAITQALENEENPILQHAACYVLEVFGETFSSMNVYIIQILSKLIPLLVCESDEVRVTAYTAALTLCDRIDCKVPDLFGQAVEIYSEVQPDDCTNYYSLLAYSIDLSQTFADENMEKVFGLLKEILQSDNTVAIAASTLIATAIIKKDNDQLAPIMELYAEVIPACMEYENVDTITFAIRFLLAIADEFKCEQMEPIVPFIPQVIEFAKNQQTAHRIREASLELLCSIFHYAASNEEIAGPIFPVLIEIFEKSLNSEDDFAIPSINGIRRVARDLDEEHRLAFFNKLVENIKEDFNTSYVTKALYTVAKLLKNMTEEENMAHSVEVAGELLKMILEGEINLLGSVKLLEADTTIDLFPSVCQLISVLVSQQSPMTEVIIPFLFEYIKRDSEIDKCKAIGALSDVVANAEIDESTTQQIISMVAEEMAEATDPSMQENIVHIFNICITTNTEYVGPISETMETLRQWWETAIENRSGYNDLLMNLSGLFLLLGILVPAFPEDLLIAVFNEMPYEDEDVTQGLYMNTVSLVGYKDVSPPVLRAIALAFGRLFAYDQKHLERMGIVEESYDATLLTFKEVLGKDPEALPAILEECSSSATRANRIKALLE